MQSWIKSEYVTIMGSPPLTGSEGKKLPPVIEG